MTQVLTGTWRGTVQVYKYENSLRIRLLAGAMKQTRMRQPDGSFKSVETGETLRDTILRVPRNIRYFVANEDGGYGTNAQWRVDGYYNADLNIRSERHCSLFLVDNDVPNASSETNPNASETLPQRDQSAQAAQDYYCSECSISHRWTTDCETNNSPCLPDENGWAHKPSCSKGAKSQAAKPEVKVNTLPRRPTDPDYIGIIQRMLTATNRDGHSYPVAMVGPSQCGKTSIAKEIAKRTEADFFSNPFSLGITEKTIMGGLQPTREAGSFVWRDSQFVQAFETEGSLYLADEFDAGDENAILVFNTALANGWMRIADRHDAPLAIRASGTMILAAMNTYGTGSNIYVGRQSLDASTRQRFNPISVDYNPAWEWDVVYGDESAQVDRNNRDALMTLTDKVRAAINGNKLRQVWSTTNITMAMSMMAVGFTLSDYTREQFAGWTEPEKLALRNKGVMV